MATRKASANATGASHAPCRNPSLTASGLLPLWVFAHAVGCTPCLPAHKLAETGTIAWLLRLRLFRLRCPEPILDVAGCEHFRSFGGHFRTNLPRHFWSSSLVVNANLVCSCCSPNLRDVSSQHR